MRLSSVEAFDPATGAWETVAAMGTARAYVGVAVLDGKLHAVGGYDSTNNAMRSVEVSTRDGGVGRVAPMGTGRMRLGVAALDGKLYAVGGKSARGGDSFESRALHATNAWEEVG